MTEVGICGTGVSIDSMDADATIRDLVARGMPFRDLEITGAGLEQAFVNLTGCRAVNTKRGCGACETRLAAGIKVRDGS